MPVKMNITLQISLSAGDASYAHLTVPALLRAHQSLECHRLLILDVIPPFWLDDLGSFPGRVATMRELCARLLRNGDVDEVVELGEHDPILKTLQRKYLRPIRRTHGVGTPLSSYVLPLELIRDGLWLHYDGDMLLYQKPGTDWVHEAAAFLSRFPDAIAASPRISPPFAPIGSPEDRPSKVKGGATRLDFDDHWRVYWISTRCFLADVNQWRNLAPFIRYRNLPELAARKLLHRGYPPSLEGLLHNAYTRPRKMFRVDLKSGSAFLLHPRHKGELFDRLLPKIIQWVEGGKVPEGQRGWENIEMEAWAKDFGASGI